MYQKGIQANLQATVEKHRTISSSHYTSALTTTALSYAKEMPYPTSVSAHEIKMKTPLFDSFHLADSNFKIKFVLTAYLEWSQPQLKSKFFTKQARKQNRLAGWICDVD